MRVLNSIDAYKYISNSYPYKALHKNLQSIENFNKSKPRKYFAYVKLCLQDIMMKIQRIESYCVV